MRVGTLSSQQLRSLVEDKWQRDEDAPAVGLHVTNSWTAPSEVEFEFGKARVVRADTVFQLRQALASAERTKGRIILPTAGQPCDDIVAEIALLQLGQQNDPVFALFGGQERLTNLKNRIGPDNLGLPEIELHFLRTTPRIGDVQAHDEGVLVSLPLVFDKGAKLL